MRNWQKLSFGKALHLNSSRFDFCCTLTIGALRRRWQRCQRGRITQSTIQILVFFKPFTFETFHLRKLRQFHPTFSTRLVKFAVQIHDPQARRVKAQLKWKVCTSARFQLVLSNSRYFRGVHYYRQQVSRLLRCVFRSRGKRTSCSFLWRDAALIDQMTWAHARARSRTKPLKRV